MKKTIRKGVGRDRPYCHIDKRWGSLVAKRRDPNNRTGKNKVRNNWICVCDCGNTASLNINAMVNRGSCGCREPLVPQRARSQARAYKAWQRMLKRCYNPKDIRYDRYGGRGIQVCAAWQAHYFNFLQDMGHCPDGYSLDRIDNNKNYEPDNCRWIKNEDQAKNRRTSSFLTYQGKTQIIADWARELGISVKTIFTRIARGSSIEKVLSTQNLQTGATIND